MFNLPKEAWHAASAFVPGGDVYLSAEHICVKKAVAEKVFGTEAVVLSVFYPKDSTFMLAPASEELFRTIHKASQQMLKSKNAAGDKSVSIQELLLDQEINASLH